MSVECCTNMRAAVALNDEVCDTKGLKITPKHLAAVNAMAAYVVGGRCPFCGATRPLRESTKET